MKHGLEPIRMTSRAATVRIVPLTTAAIRSAKRIGTLDSRVACRISSDALGELTAAKTRRRLRAKAP